MEEQTNGSYHVETTHQGFKVLSITAIDTIEKLGGLGICDSCNQAALTGKYIAALNSYYCKRCYDRWVDTATYYHEDKEIETNRLNRTLSLLKS